MILLKEENMALSKGAKIALGCGIAFVVLAGGISVVIFGAAWWGFGKAKEVAQRFEGDQKRAEEALQRANSNPFSPPADGIIAEERLVRFLAVRKKMNGAYLKHKGLIEAQAKKKDPDLSALAQLPGIMLELRAAKAEGLAEQAMSENEFNWFTGAVYRSLVIASLSPDGKSVSEIARSGGEEIAEQAEQAADAAEANPNVPPETKQQLREQARMVREQAQSAADSSRALDVPPANLALFEKHKEEILRYTMGGLELLPI